MIPVNSDMPVNRLLGNANLIKGEGDILTVCQEAEIAGRNVKITLTFNHAIDDSQAQKAMNANLDKIVQLIIAYKLGESDESGEITRRLTVQNDAKVIRSYTKENLVGLHSVTYQPDQVQDQIISKVQNYIYEHPIQAGINDPPSDEVPYTPVNNFPLPGRSKLKLSAYYSSERGKYFKDSFVVNNKKVAKERVYRAETVSMLTGSLSAKIESLKASIVDLEKTNVLEFDCNPKTHESLRKAKNELSNTEEDLKMHSRNTKGATHGSVNAPRFAFLKMGRTTAKKEMVPVLSNLRMQTVEDAQGKIVSAVTRSAAITDFSHGEVSLQELKDLKDLGKCLFLTKNGLRTPEETRVEDKMKGFYLKDDERGEIGDLALLVRTKALVGYGADALVVDSFKSEKLTNLLEKIQSSSNIEAKFKTLTPEEKSLLRELIIDDKKLNEVINKRTNFLKQLVLQDLQVHLETTPVKNNGPILYGRTALVDLQKAAVKQAGGIIHERTQGLDMKAVFDELKGAELIFEDNISAAYIDENGKIHMPKNCAVEGLKEATLSPVFFNICVQGSKGHTLNKGMQKVINDQALQVLKEQFGESAELTALEDSLGELAISEENDPNASILLVTQFLQKNGGYSGINCFGGKDRTGYSVALITHAKIAELVDMEVSDPGERRTVMKRIGHQLIGSNGVAAKIAKDNADHTVLKVTRFDLLLYDTGSLKGKMLRIAHGIDSIFVVLKPMLKGLFGFAPLAISSTPGQLYRDEHQTSHKTNNIFDRFVSMWRSKKSNLDQSGLDHLDIEFKEII